MILIAISLSILGLGPQNPSDSAVRPAYRICGIDRTGSYSYVGAAVNACAQVIQRANPGDVVSIRWISDVSYATSEQVVLVRLPLAATSAVHQSIRHAVPKGRQARATGDRRSQAAGHRAPQIR